ncbi:MAG: hypothetical protein ACU0BK_06485 [Shimia sp.]|uniref:hypothetical protein n=1 Tax=unclassified Shimia TaxID=2630038 RepID=UPI0006B4D2E9|nr:hypothetical protein [Shimia sp. SK013]KPA20336.1 hypothetical protein shim_33250 [Shimia sp. SK013]
MSNDLQDLQTITQANYQKAQTSMQSVQLEESRLRALLAELTDKENTGRVMMASDSALQRTGADENWMRWIARSRRILNMQLANVLVRKETAFRELQAHFGKADVMEKLLEDQIQTQRAQRQTRLVTSILELELSCGRSGR